MVTKSRCRASGWFGAVCFVLSGYGLQSCTIESVSKRIIGDWVITDYTKDSVSVGGFLTPYVSIERDGDIYLPIWRLDQDIGVHDRGSWKIQSTDYTLFIEINSPNNRFDGSFEVWLSEDGQLMSFSRERVRINFARHEWIPW